MAQFIRGASTERYCNSVVQTHSRPPHKAHSEMVSNWHRCWMWKPQLQVELLEFCHTHGTDNPKYLQKQKIRKTENVKICHTSSVYHPNPPHPTHIPSPPPPKGLSVIGGLWAGVERWIMNCFHAQLFWLLRKKVKNSSFQITICKSKTFVGQRNCMSFYERMNERTNERMNEWMNEWMNPRFVHENPGQSNEISSVILSLTIWFSLFYKIKVNISFSSNFFFVTLGKGSYGEQRLPTRYTTCIP